MRLITVIYDDLNILPHFLRHYTSLGVKQFIAGVYIDRGLMDATRKIARHYNVEFVPILGAYAAVKDIQFAFRMAKEQIRRDEWWVVADVDEFHEFPGPLPQIVKELDSANALFLCGDLIERIAADGACPPLDQKKPIWDQFPAAAAIRRLTRTCPTKVMLVRGHHRFRGGHHSPEPRHRHKAVWKGHVHHFKWHGRAIDRLAEQIVRLRKQGRGYHRGLRRFLKFWMVHRRMPIAGELGFYRPAKPSSWPD